MKNYDEFTSMMLEKYNEKIGEDATVAEAERFALETAVNALAKKVFGDPHQPDLVKEANAKIQEYKEQKLLSGFTKESTVIIQVPTFLSPDRIKQQEESLKEKFGCNVVLLDGHHELAAVLGKETKLERNPKEDWSNPNGPVYADAYDARTQQEMIVKKNEEGTYDIFKRQLCNEGVHMKNQKQVNIKSFPDQAEAIRFMYTKAAEYFGGK